MTAIGSKRQRQESRKNLARGLFMCNVSAHNCSPFVDVAQKATNNSSLNSSLNEEPLSESSRTISRSRRFSKGHLAYFSKSGFVIFVIGA